MPSPPLAGQGGSEAITLIVTMSIKPEFEDEFLDMARAFADKVYANEPGTLLYVLTKHPTQEHTYVWVERYRHEAALTQHVGTAYMAEARPRLAEFLDSPPELLRLAQVIPGK